MLSALILVYSEHPEARVGSATFACARAFTFDIMHIYAFKMTAVFMITDSTLAVHTRFVARWIALLGYVGAAILLFGGGYFDWALFVFPFWVLLVSTSILIDNLRSLDQRPTA